MSVLLPKPVVPKHWVLDANVLFSEWSRAIIKSLADTHLAQLHWTDQIQHECYRNLVRLGRLHADDADLEQLDLAASLQAKCHVYDAHAYLADVKAVDEKDRHVAAVGLALRHALQANVGIITWNLKDFPRKPLLKLGLVRYSPDELFTELIADPAQALQTLRHTAEGMKRTLHERKRLHPTPYELAARPLPESTEQWLEFLARNRQHKTAKLVSILLA
ncbi:MAG TPA: PIN domain-containing protein [Limnobacter sp.]|nr:PIN domain-containing protein [Limnobacter sp.]